MTAPLQYSLKDTQPNKNDLHHLTQELIIAINKNQMFKIEDLIEKMLKQNVSSYFLYTFYFYAEHHNKTLASGYIEQILLINNNLCSNV